MPAAGGNEAFDAGRRISPEGQHILQAEEVQLYQIVLKLVGRRAATDEVGDHRDIEGVLDQGGEAQGARSLSHRLSLQQPVGALDVDHLFLVVGHVDVRGIELHQKADVLHQRLKGSALKRRNQLKGEQRLFCILNNLGDTHALISHILKKGSKVEIINTFSLRVALKLSSTHFFDGTITNSRSADDRPAHRSGGVHRVAGT